MKWKYLYYAMKNRNSKSPWKRMIAKCYTAILKKSCRRERRRLAKKYICITPPRYTAKDILRRAGK